MDNIRKTIEILFQKESPERVMKEYFKPINKFDYTEGVGDNFVSKFTYANPLYYTDDEVENVMDMVESNWMKISHYEKEKSIFNILINFTKDVLREINGEPLCKYKNLLKWRELSFGIDEDILTTSYLAYNDLISNRTRKKFAWKPVVSTDNHFLKELFKKGIAENHYHLKGSAPHFKLSWISLMNDPFKRGKEFKNLMNETRRTAKVNYNFKNKNETLELLILKASYIRFFLYQKLKVEISENKRDEYIKKELLLAKNVDEFKLELGDLKEQIKVIKFLDGRKFGSENEIPDYCIPSNISSSNFNTENKGYNGNLFLYGERKFLYDCFKNIYNKNGKLKNYHSIFYSYLLIKQEFRSEIVQINTRVGFKNFAHYQNRKNYFIPEGSIYEKAIYNMAINSAIYDQHIDSLEGRIAPKGTMAEYEKSIQEIDDAINNRVFYEENLLEKYDELTYCDRKFLNQNMNRKNLIHPSEKYKEDTKKNNIAKLFYTVHFIKTSEKYKDIKKYGGNLSYEKKERNYKVRRNVELKAKELNELRKSSYKSSKRILGIDAANFEVGCRPEVFGQAFRFLKNYSHESELSSLTENNFKELGLTYHVGEDYLDLISGLRAIDEAILFLELDQGDRLGHALALGINPKDYYKSKNYNVTLPKHDLLDNCVWLLSKIREYGLDVSSKLIFELNNEFNCLFDYIYGEDIQRENKHCSLDIYYEAWKLRGDNPTYYDNKKFNMKSPLTFWDRSGVRHECSLNQNRENSTVLDLFYNYHYSASVKIKGAISEEYKITSEYTDAVEKLQNAMQQEVRNKNLYIETNPSSNYLISSFKRYSKHPIVNFFNLGLTYDNNELKKCSQIPVSINTDDQGVFATYLENEYALMAISLEKEKNEDGNPKYNQAMIYDWLDKIRMFGLEQSFNRRQINK